ncbi:MAG: family 20 glycosylhydrolase [Lentisphaerota bacterium]
MRALQLDLARHMESVDFIKHYAGQAADCGFNTLVLYLEGRVKTNSFPFRPPDESYTPKQMAEVVVHAEKLGLEIVPTISTLGHCEQFLACEQLKHLSETRNGRGRWGETKGPGHVICPSLDETYDFFGRYLADIADIFPSAHLHLGLDEAWDLGFCERCDEHRRLHGLSSLFMRHLERIHGIASALGKRIWFWDDMFELFPEEISRIPKDAVVCHWCYDVNIQPEGIQAHFVNRARKNWLREYKHLGLDVLICPWDRLPLNIVSFTDYARREKVMGGFLTQWEISPRLYPPAQSTITAFAGELWNADVFDPENAWQKATARTIPGISSPCVDAVRTLLEPGVVYPSGKLSSYLNGLPVREELIRKNAVKLASDIINRERVENPLVAKSRDLELAAWFARLELIHWDLRELAPRIVDPCKNKNDIPLLRRRIQGVQSRLSALQLEWESMSGRLRLNEQIQDKTVVDTWFSVSGVLDDMILRLSQEPSPAEWLLILRLHLQDFYSAPWLKATAIAGDREQVLADGSFKHGSILGGIMGGRIGGNYDLYVPFISDLAPESIRLEGGGHGGQGVTYLELRNMALTLTPIALDKIEGSVIHPEALLRDDSVPTIFGGLDTLAQIHDPELVRQRSRMEVKLAKR